MQAIVEPPEVFLPPTCNCCRTRPMLNHNGVLVCKECDKWPAILVEREEDE